MVKGSEELPDYYNVPKPEGKPKTEWDVDERRGYLLRRIIRLGDPKMLNQTKFADMFGVSQQMISKDVKYIGKSIAQHIDSEQLKMEFETAFKTLKREAINNRDFDLYLKTIDKYANWLFNIGAVEKEPEKMEHKGLGDLTIELVTVDED